MNFPFAVLILAFVTLWLAAELGAILRGVVNPIQGDEQNDFDIVLSATLTLLGLLIGFTFSMAVTRYDLRKACEESEANAIGTEYERADLLPKPAAEKIRALLKQYLGQRILFYSDRDSNELRKIAADTSKLQNQLWLAVKPTPGTEPTPVVALVISGMNDVLNSQGYTQAAWWNRIPIAAWVLMAAIAVCCNVLLGYRARRRDLRIFLIVPIAVSIAFFLIADIDSPRGGVIRVAPNNLTAVSQFLQARELN